MPAPQKSVNTLATSSLTTLCLTPSPAAKLYTYLQLPNHILRPFSQFFSHAHKQPASHPLAHRAHAAKSIKHVNYFQYLPLTTSPAANLYSYPSLPPKSLPFSYTASTILIHSPPAIHLITMSTLQKTSNKVIHFPSSPAANTTRRTSLLTSFCPRTSACFSLLQSYERTTFLSPDLFTTCASQPRSTKSVFQHPSHTVPFTQHIFPGLFFNCTNIFRTFIWIFFADDGYIILSSCQIELELDSQPLAFGRISILAASHPQGIVQYNLLNSYIHVLFTTHQSCKLLLL